MSSSFPVDGIRNAFQRFAYNIDLIEKRYANKRPSGLELDCDTGKIIQVIDPKRPRLTAEEAREKLKTSLLAPESLFGNSSLSSPFVHDMTAPRETKLRVLKHNKRFEQQLNNGVDCSTFLADENDNDEYSGYNENREEEELFNLDDIEENDDAEDEDGDDIEEEEGDDEEEEETVDAEILESEEDDVGPSDEQDKELEDELDKEKENEDLPFEEPEEEAAKDGGINYEGFKITRSLIQRLTPKIARKKKTSKISKNITPLVKNETPKAKPQKRKSVTSALKERNEAVEGTPKMPKKKITKSLSAKAVPKTPTESKKITKAASEKLSSKTALDESTPKKVRGRSKKLLLENASSNVTPLATTSTGKKIAKTASAKEKETQKVDKSTPKKKTTEKKNTKATTAASSKTPTASTKITKAVSEKASTKKKIQPSKEEKTPKETATKSKKINTKAASEKLTSKTPEAPIKKTRGRPRKSLPMIEAATATPKKSGRSRKSVA